MDLEAIIHRLNLAAAKVYSRPSACRFCQIPCDWTTREYRAQRCCLQCYQEELPTLKLVRKPLPKKETVHEVHHALEVSQS